MVNCIHMSNIAFDKVKGVEMREMISEAMILKIVKLNRMCKCDVVKKTTHIHSLLFYFFIWITESIQCACDTLRVNTKRTRSHASTSKIRKIYEEQKKTNEQIQWLTQLQMFLDATCIDLICDIMLSSMNFHRIHL